MIDKQRILAKIDELDKYLYEIQSIAPKDFEDFKRIEIKRSSERLLQLSIECIIDICKIIVSNLKLGLPSEENDLFDKMEREKIITEEMALILKEMKGFRNILVHEYTEVDDEIVYSVIKNRLDDFKKFKKQIIDWMG
ncbi:MAG: hypothetical protein IGBAC_0868 [Ignavibacteriae bacterium]|nr:MAG: hypothetical protein IGBAC_0868 [Ignavibacteriota bacterium]